MSSTSRTPRSASPFRSYTVASSSSLWHFSRDAPPIGAYRSAGSADSRGGRAPDAAERMRNSSKCLNLLKHICTERDGLLPLRSTKEGMHKRAKLSTRLKTGGDVASAQPSLDALTLSPDRTRMPGRRRPTTGDTDGKSLEASRRSAGPRKLSPLDPGDRLRGPGAQRNRGRSSPVPGHARCDPAGASGRQLLHPRLARDRAVSAIHGSQ